MIRFSFLYRWPCFFSLSGHVFNCLSRNFDRACLSMDLFFRLPHLSLIRLSMWRILFLQFGRFSFHCFFHYLPLFYLFSSLGTSFGQQLSLLDSFSIFLNFLFISCVVFCLLFWTVGNYFAWAFKSIIWFFTLLYVVIHWMFYFSNHILISPNYFSFGRFNNLSNFSTDNS